VVIAALLAPTQADASVASVDEPLQRAPGLMRVGLVAIGLMVDLRCVDTDQADIAAVAQPEGVAIVDEIDRALGVYPIRWAVRFSRYASGECEQAGG
jgi:hypothetical protein